MQSNDNEKFIELLSQLSEIFNNGSSISDNAASIYFDILKNETIENIERSVIFLLRNRTYHGFPKPAEIINAVVESKNDGWN